MKAILIAAALAMVSIGGIASAGLWNDLKTAVVGHSEDAFSRVFGEDQIISGEIIKEGIFDTEADGQDLAHWAEGGISIIIKDGKRYVQLNEDFNSGPLPDGYVYISVDTDINNTTDFDNSTQIEVGKLINGKGASFYEIPEGAVVNSVTILCKQFHVYIGSGDVN
jgi:hypothetical protein